MEEISHEANLQKINEEIYKRNLELAIVNKTLSLLRKLYQISLLALKPEPLAQKIAETVLADLNMDFAGIYLFDAESDSLSPLKFAKSQRLSDAGGVELGKIFSKKIGDIKEHDLLKKLVYRKLQILNGEMVDLWPSVASKPVLEKISSDAHVKTVLAFPLVTKNSTLGVLVFGLNRNYHSLTTREQESINSLIDVVAVAMDNALLYGKLEATNKQLMILDRARAEFITIASHQLRTPPATIKWYLAAVMAGDFGKLNPKIAEAIQKAQVTNNGLISLIDDMLNVSRIERGKMEFIFEKTNLQKILEEVVIALTPQAKVKNLKLEYKKPKIKIIEILADQEKIKQVINNLVDNAIKYTKKGGVKVEITQTAEDILVKVRDTGKGLEKGDEAKIFDKYSRSKDSVQHASGLGLGLYVAKIIVEHHNGRLTAESPGAGKGTTFTVALPIKSSLKAETFDLTKMQDV